MMELLMIAVALTFGGLAYSFRSKRISIKSTSNYKQQAQVKLKKAVKLKKTNMDEAIVLLKEAYEDGEATSLQEFLRLPNYLRLNKQYDEAYQECSKLAQGLTPYESYSHGSWQWFYDQIEILRLQSQLCIDENKYKDAIYCNTDCLEYYIRAEEARQKTGRQRDFAQSNLERLFQDSNYQQDIVLGKVFKKMGACLIFLWTGSVNFLTTVTNVTKILAQYFWKEHFDTFDNQCDVHKAAFCDSR